MKMLFNLEYIPRKSRYYNLLKKTGCIIQSNEYRSLFQPINLDGKPDGPAIWLPKEYFELNDDPKWEKAYDLYEKWKAFSILSYNEIKSQKESIIKELADKYGLTKDIILEIASRLKL